MLEPVSCNPRHAGRRTAEVGRDVLIDTGPHRRPRAREIRLEVRSQSQQRFAVFGLVARRPMLAKMAAQWRTFQRLAGTLVFNEAPKLVRQLQRSPAVQRGIKLGLDAIIAATSEPPAELTAGRPVTKNSAPAAHRARTITYHPDLDGRADPGEIVWTWVTNADDPTRGKDRPVLVVGRDHTILLGLMLSSQEPHPADRSWVGIGSGSWDDEGRPSWVRLDRVLDVPEEGIRREGAILERAQFDVVAARLRRDYAWR